MIFEHANGKSMDGAFRIKTAFPLHVNDDYLEECCVELKKKSNQEVIKKPLITKGFKGLIVAGSSVLIVTSCNSLSE